MPLPLRVGTMARKAFAVATASPTLGKWMKRVGLCAIPEDFAPPKEIQAVMGAKP